tara:strand:- start:332 stop:706 length:375 start_codon:yes stop_codon:yes gene_type:complete
MRNEKFEDLELDIITKYDITEERFHEVMTAVEPLIESKPKPRIKNGRERFVEVGVKRFQAAFDAIESLRNIGNRRNYFYTNNEAIIMINALREELAEVEKVMVRRPMSNIYDILGVEKPAKRSK